MSEHVVSLEPAPTSQEIECPGCGHVFHELVTENVGGCLCPECGDGISFDRGDTDDSTPTDDTEQTTLLTDGGVERGPALLAWWEDSCGRPWQFLVNGDWFAVRHREDGEWRYLGSWVSYNGNHGVTNRAVHTDSDRS